MSDKKSSLFTPVHPSPSRSRTISASWPFSWPACSTVSHANPSARYPFCPRSNPEVMQLGCFRRAESGRRACMESAAQRRTTRRLDWITGQADARDASGMVARELRVRPQRDGVRRPGVAPEDGAGVRGRLPIRAASRHDRPAIVPHRRARPAAPGYLALPALVAGVLLLVAAEGIAATVGGALLVYLSWVGLVASVFVLVGDRGVHRMRRTQARWGLRRDIA